MAIRRFAVDLASCSCTAPAKGLAIVASAIFHTSLDRNSMIDHFVPKNWFSKGMLRSIWFFLNRALCVFQCNFPFFITFTSLKEPKTSSLDKQQREFLKSLPAVTVLEMLLPYVRKQVEAHQLVAQWPTKHHISWFVWVRTWKLSQVWWTFLARNETYRCNMWIYTVICQIISVLVKNTVRKDSKGYFMLRIFDSWSTTRITSPEKLEDLFDPQDPLQEMRRKQVGLCRSSSLWVEIFHHSYRGPKSQQFFFW